MMENWTEVRTVYYLALLGTVSAASETLGMHRVTVIRHVDLLEAALGEKLFTRHAKGYTPTQAGRELMMAAQATEERFAVVAARLRALAEARRGDLLLTSLPVVAPLLMPAIAAYQRAHPGVLLRHVATARSLRLEQGEAHVAVRVRVPGAAAEPDAVILPLTRFSVGLYASDAYIARCGAPIRVEDLAEHAFVAPEPVETSTTARLYNAWLSEIAPERTVAFRSTDLAAVDAAVAGGVGLGFMPAFAARERGLRPILGDALRRPGELDIVTHVDLHRTPKIQGLVKALREEVPQRL